MLINYVDEAVCLAIMFAICAIHAAKFNRNEKITVFFHATWLIVYCIPIIFFLFYNWSWWLLIALGLERAVMYNQILNILRKKPFWYIHSDPKTGSVIDRFLIKLGWWYPIAWFLLLGVFIFIQFKL